MEEIKTGDTLTTTDPAFVGELPKAERIAPVFALAIVAENRSDEVGRAKEVRMHCSGEGKTKSPQCDSPVSWKTRGSCEPSVRLAAVTYS